MNGATPISSPDLAMAVALDATLVWLSVLLKITFILGVIALTAIAIHHRRVLSARARIDRELRDRAHAMAAQEYAGGVR